MSYTGGNGSNGIPDKLPEWQKQHEIPSQRCSDLKDIRPIVPCNLGNELPEFLSTNDPFEVDRRGGTQHFKDVFGKDWVIEIIGF